MERKIKVTTRLIRMLVVLLCFIAIPHFVKANDNIIRIRTVTDLYNVRYNLDGHYLLMNDLDVSTETAQFGVYSYKGLGWLPIGCDEKYQATPFTGVFDGNGHTISGLYSYAHPLDNTGFDTFYGGLFGINEGIIRNLNLSDLNLEYGRQVSGTDCQINDKGILGAVTAVNSGTIKNCSTSGIIKFTMIRNTTNKSSENALGSAGGIAGVGTENSVIERCHSDCSIDFQLYYNSVGYYNGGLVTGRVGGILGEATDNSVSIKNCINTGEITATSKTCRSNGTRVGGILGGIEGYVENCYNAGTIFAQDKGASGIGGGIVKTSYNIGQLPENHDKAYAISESSSITNCYYKLGTIGSYGISNGALALSEEQLSIASSFPGFDFSSVWQMSTDPDYPYPTLREEIDMLEVTKVPDKTTYYTDDGLKLDGGKLTIYYVDGRSETIDITIDMVSGYDMTAVGRQDVTVDYLRYTDTFQIVVAQRPELKELTLASPPDKTEFVRGTKFDFSGCQAEAVYANGVTEVIDVDDTMTSGGDINSSGDYLITYTLQDKSVSFNVKVIPVKVTGIEVAVAPYQTVYVPGESFNAKGMEVCTVYNNGNKETIDNYTIGEMPLDVGDHELRIDYNDYSTTVGITIEKQNPAALMISKKPDKTQYIEGEDFDSQGMVVSGIYNSGYAEILTDYLVSDIPEGTGKKDVTISYKGLTAKVSVTVVEKELLSIEIAEFPDRTEYIEGQTFVKDGLVVNALYNNGKKEEVTDYRITNIDTDTIGTNKIYVSYSGFAASFYVTVVEKALQKISVKEPDKIEYLPGEEFDTQGLVVTAHYNNGKSEEINDYTLDGFTGKPGDSLIIVSYENRQTNFIVTVHKPSGNWVIKEDVTCQKTGTRVQYCSDCGQKVIEEEIPIKEHTVVMLEEKPATCTETGLTEGSKCSACNEILVEQEVIPAKGHKYGEWKSDGKYGHIHICENDASHTETEPHIYGEWNVVKEATYDQIGQGEHTCTICNYKEQESIPKLEKSANQVAAESAISVISSLPANISSSDEAAIQKARAAYNSLSADQKKLVPASVLSKLTAAESKITAIKEAAKKKDFSKSGPAIGSTVTVSGQGFTVTGNSTITFTKAANKKSIKVPEIVTISGKNYTVTAIGSKAFTAKKIRTVTIGKSVSAISKNAFAKSKATKLIVKSKLLKKKTVKGSLKGSKIKTVQVKVGAKKMNKKFIKTYKKIFTKKNAGKKVSVK